MLLHVPLEVCGITSLEFGSSMVNALVVTEAVQSAIHLVTNVADGCLSRMGMNVLNVTTQSLQRGQTFPTWLATKLIVSRQVT